MIGNDTIGNDTFGNDMIDNDTIGNDTIRNDTIGNDRNWGIIPKETKATCKTARRSSRSKKVEIFQKRYCPKCSANLIAVTPIWKWEFRNGGIPLGGCTGFLLKNVFSNFCFHIKDSKWGRKYDYINYTSHNGSPQQIPLRQLSFANEAKPCYRCRACWALWVSVR